MSKVERSKSSYSLKINVTWVGGKRLPKSVMYCLTESPRIVFSVPILVKFKNLSHNLPRQSCEQGNIYGLEKPGRRLPMQHLH